MSYKIGKLAGCMCGALLLSVLAGCSAGDASDNTTDTTEIAEIAESDLFTDRDLAGTYEEEDAVVITLSDGSSACSGSGVSIDGDVITITKEGTYLLSGSLSDGQIVVDTNSSAKVQLVLSGVDITCSDSAAIYVIQADKVFLTLAEGTENRIGTTGEFAETEEGIDAAIYAKDDLTLNGSGSLTVTCPYGHGIVSKDDLKLTGGTYTITAAAQGLSGNDSVRIADGVYQITAEGKGIKSDTAIYLTGGEITINSTDDAVHSNGLCTISGGSYTIASGDDGVHADGALTINGGTITITESYEGLEGMTITINGGEISLAASDDGMNAAGGNDSSGFGGMMNDAFASDDDCWIEINGGTLVIEAGGDGIDSNGDLTVNGGEVYVSGPTSSADGALDYGGEATITGGIVVAAGASGMAENFGDSSTQGSMLVSFSQSIQGTVTLADADGNEILSYTPTKSYNCVVISCPEITADGVYTVTCGTETTTVEMSGLIYGGGMMGGMGQPGGGGMGQFGDGDMEQPGDGTMELPEDGDMMQPGGGMGQFGDGDMGQRGDGSSDAPENWDTNRQDNGMRGDRTAE